MKMSCYWGVRTCVAASLAALLLPAFALAHLEPAAGQGKSPAASSGPGDRSPVALEERLGSKIPLDLVFRDESGREVRLAQLITGPTIILPVYYRCSNVCNVLQGDLARVLPDIRRVPGVDYRVLSVSIDETETPEAAARARKMYLAAMEGRFPETGWRFLTGDAAGIRALTKAAGFSFRREGSEFAHPVVSIVVAGDGKIVRYLYGTGFLAKDLTLAFAEAGEGRTGKTIRRVVGYCFSYDSQKKSYEFNLLRVCATVVLACCGSFFLFLVLTGRSRRGVAGEK